MMSEEEIKKTLQELPPEVRLAMEKELLGSSRVAVNILKALKERGWQVGNFDAGHWPEDRDFSPAPDAEVTKIIDVELEKGGML